jgi:hypothetical protein
VQWLQETTDFRNDLEHSRMIDQKGERPKRIAIQLTGLQGGGVAPILQKVMMKIDFDRTSFGACSA